jgi:hypothetical protein
MAGLELATYDPYQFGPETYGSFEQLPQDPEASDVVMDDSFEAFDSFLAGIEGVALGVGQTAVFAAKEVIAHIAEDGHATEEIIPERPAPLKLGELAISSPEPEKDTVPANTRYEEFILGQFKDTDFN